MMGDQKWKIVRPFGVDLCGGVRTHDSLDQTKVDEFMNEAHRLAG
ncbi:MAG TPA: hypothetical protein QF611_06735 [Pseudomonadales bacterium]|jgi:hypothetical protein|nr:hypothetical protein [Pseudomonadales bacterium]HJP50705.1 hypothetical protein [Pseudomonadales bacterium]|tara:strand:- start:589 stop:723 length:135 start_codon:yes stop_codon:yes gene_type:complete